MITRPTQSLTFELGLRSIGCAPMSARQAQPRLSSLPISFDVEFADASSLRPVADHGFVPLVLPWNFSFIR
jgi:hypothetical protein